MTPHPLVALLYRRRTFILLISILLILAFSQPRLSAFVVGVILCVVGEGIRIWASGTLRKTRTLTTGGPYAWVRHPLYVGSFFLAMGYCAMSGRWQSYVLGMPVFFVVHGAAVVVEEQVLLKLYGDEYRAYSARVARFVPRPGAALRGERQFALRQAFANREQMNLLCVLLITGFFVARLALGW
ncbi:MAG: isoprenylcysteine carboxylmethyltransferase family protein [Armatimonadetes bacterium]|nr:isoprenylcysteine carboxylmethyltransferase family protein [Armatimonadota bacterium]